MKLQTVLALVVLVVLRTTHGMESFCDATQNVSCHGTLGQPLYLRLIRTTTDYDLNFDRATNRVTNRIFQFKRNKSIFRDPERYSGSWTFFSDNGTLIINPVESTDSGTYKVEIFFGSGIRGAKNYVRLIVNETTLMTQTISNSTHPSSITHIPLHNDAYLSEEQRNIIFTIMVVLGSLLCLIVSGGLFYYCTRTKNTDRAEPEELVYADVSIQRRQMKQLDQRKRQEEMVEYGEVNVQRGHTPVDPEQCFSLALYAEVKTRHNKQ
ncbi:uncharacterized protein LOC134069286 isoform X2 [Sardina pilchardus]|uniref:uncharacterized protein LOC134069286 isoform X2 n=1 Tax=Sardina pilchardus TaxID=27697 RepID=UPI002E1275D9